MRCSPSHSWWEEKKVIYHYVCTLAILYLYVSFIYVCIYIYIKKLRRVKNLNIYWLLLEKRIQEKAILLGSTVFPKHSNWDAVYLYEQNSTVIYVTINARNMAKHVPLLAFNWILLQWRALPKFSSIPFQILHSTHLTRSMASLTSYPNGLGLGISHCDNAHLFPHILSFHFRLKKKRKWSTPIWVKWKNLLFLF